MDDTPGRSAADGSGGMLDELVATLAEDGLLKPRPQSFWTTFAEATCHPRVRTLLGWETPSVTDLSDILDVRNGGRVQAVRMDRFPGVGNLKKPVIAGLLLKETMRGKIPSRGVDTLIDAGNMNTGYALKYYCAKCGLRGHYVMSRYFPRDMIQMLEDETFTVEQAPPSSSLGVEEEFYHYLYLLVRAPDSRANKHCLWHAKYGGTVLRPLGTEIAASIGEGPDFIVVSIGAGSTLECLRQAQRCLEARGGRAPAVVVPEHELSPIYARRFPSTPPKGVPFTFREDACMRNYDPGAFRRPGSCRIAHSVIGPHYERPNPLLSEEVLVGVSRVQQYSDEEWMMASHYLESRGLPVGNSSAAHIVVACGLANEGYDVLTVIMEPMRAYYKNASSAGNAVSDPLSGAAAAG